MGKNNWTPGYAYLRKKRRSTQAKAAISVSERTMKIKAARISCSRSHIVDFMPQGSRWAARPPVTGVIKIS